MKKTKKNSNKIEFTLSADEMLELLNFFEYVRDEKEAWCNTAGKVHAQLREIVLARIEGRKPRIVLDQNTVLSVDAQKLQKLAFDPDRVSTNSKLYEKYKAASIEEIIQNDKLTKAVNEVVVSSVKEHCDEVDKKIGEKI